MIIKSRGGKPKDLSGMRFGKLVVEEPTGVPNREGIVWRCKCDCGGTCEYPAKQLLSGWRKDCGCESRERSRFSRLFAGARFGRLTIVGKHSDSPRDGDYWDVICDCGTRTIKSGRNLLYYGTSSCGCLAKEKAAQLKKKHEKYKHPLYSHWNNMKTRCLNENRAQYKDYGGRGITICDEWLHDFESFYEWSIKNGFHEGLSLDRIDVNGNYEPSNCKWSTHIEQSNNKRTNHIISVRGEDVTMAEAARKYNVSYGTVRNRIAMGWSGDEAVFGRHKNGANS